MANAGRVAIVPKGDYSSTVAYKRLDLVRYENDLYIAKKANTGVSPTDTTTWMICMENVTQTQYDALINGTTKAGDALKLNGLTEAEVGESGARNLVPYPFYQTTKTVNNITFTDNGDGTITVNGTATATATFHATNNLILKAGTYTFSGGVDGGAWATYHIRLNEGETSFCNLYDSASKTFTLTKDTQVRMIISIGSGQKMENATFKPMIEPGKVAHPWKPYHSGGAEHALSADNATNANNADTVDGWHIINNPSELGFTGQFTMEELCAALSDKQRFV